MKKIGKIIKNNLKLVIGIIIGVIISGGVVYAANLAATSIDYDDSNTSLGATTVQGAVEKLYEKAKNAGIDSNSIDFGTLATNTAKTVLASKNGVCIKRNGTVSCFKANNWSVEKKHIQQVFSDISCSVATFNVDCGASDFYCIVRSYGFVSCFDQSDDSSCSVESDGSVNCS